MTVAIERITEEPGTVLVVDLGVSRPDNWIEPSLASVEPGMVRQLIQRALDAGWVPDSEGGAFRLHCPLEPLERHNPAS